MLDERFDLLHLPISNVEGVPSLRQINTALDFVIDCMQGGLGVLIHCHYGKDRTGTLLALSIMKIEGLSGAESLAEIRRLRRDSVRSPEQERLILSMDPNL